MNNLLTRLTASVENTKEIRALFNSKHAHILVAAFKAFIESGYEDKAFGIFLEWFVNGGNEAEIDGKTWNVLGIDRSTRDTNTVHGKVSHLVALFKECFNKEKKAA